MALWTVNLDEVEEIIENLEKIKNKILNNPDLQSNLKEESNNYISLKNYFMSACKFLQYYELLDPTFFFRVRPLDSEEIFTHAKDLKYKEKDFKSLGRLNNPLINVLYTSLSDQTAMLECNLDKAEIGQKFQLTRFQTKDNIRVYRLGIFAEIYLNTGIDTPKRKSSFKHFLKDEKPSYRVLKGLAALETCLLDILYADANQTESNYILSALLAHTIFELNENRIDAIIYPSQKHRFGMNVAFKQDFSEKIDIFHTEVKEIRKIYKSGFFQCYSLKECKDCKVTPYIFEDCEPNLEINYY